MKGFIRECRGNPDPNSYVIEGEDRNEYFAHIGDLRKNERILEKSKETEVLHEKDKVEFDIFDATIRKNAFHVKKVN